MTIGIQGEAVLSTRRLASARGVAVFAASQRSLLQTFALASLVPNRLVVDEEPYLVPLLEVLHRQRRYLVGDYSYASLAIGVGIRESGTAPSHPRK